MGSDISSYLRQRVMYSVGVSISEIGHDISAITSAFAPCVCIILSLEAGKVWVALLFAAILVGIL